MIKLIALLAMFVDHLGLVFFPDSFIFRIIGRMSMPLFAYCIARGFYYSQQRGSFRKYILNMLVFALISQLPYYMMDGNSLNIGFTWLFSLLLLSAAVKVRETMKDAEDKLEVICKAILGFSFILAASHHLPIDYDMYGVITPLFFYMLIVRNKETTANYVFALLAGWALYVFLEEGSPGSMAQLISVASAFVLTVSKPLDSKIRMPKWFFYAFYPAHIAILVFIKELCF